MKRQLERNDLRGARLFYKQNKPITSAQAQMLLMLQDDNTELREVMKKESWQVVERKPSNAAQRLNKSR